MKFVRNIVSWSWKNKKKLFKIAGYAAFFGFIFIGFLFVYYSKDLPSREAINDLFVPESTKIFDRTGTTVLYDIYDEYNRTVVAQEQIPENIRNATIVAEDSNFYHHKGINVKGIARALLVNLRSGSIEQGGSTITQQYVKNLLLTPERTWARKIKEAILAVEVEFLFSKEEILTRYLNYVPYGSNAYGVEAAAKTYFNKSAIDLTLGEAAVLAALPKSPTYYTNNLDALFARQQKILDRMLEFGYIGTDEYQLALEEEINFEPHYRSLQAPHYVLYIRQYLENKYGPEFLKNAGLRVITTLDKSIQEAAEEAISEGAKNNLQFRGHNASLVAIDPHTGQVLAMVGSKNYFGEGEPEGCIAGKNCLFDPQVNVAMALRQPGSSFKPFAYAAALEKGYTPDTVVYDVPTEFNPTCLWSGTQETGENGQKCYNPQNYDGAYYGPMTFKEAIAQSRNVPAVKVLYLAGLENTLDLAQRMGIESLKNRVGLGLSLVLGGADVTLLEETAAFGVFAAQGEKNATSFILRVEDKDGNVLEEYRKDSQKVMDANVANQINYMLSKNEFRAPVFGEQNYLNIPGLPVAAKTGTTQDFRDAWTVGYTPNISAGVWVGNNNNLEMINNASGSTVAAPIWNRFMRLVYEKKQNEPKELKEKEFYFTLPAFDAQSGFSEPNIEKTGKAVLDGIRGLGHTILYYLNKDNPRAGGSSINDPQYQNWENAIRAWMQSRTPSPTEDENKKETEEPLEVEDAE